MSFSVVADGDDARRAPQGVILVVLNQFVKAFGTNVFLRVITTKRHFFWHIFCPPIWHSYFIWYNCLAFFLFLSGGLPAKFSEILCSRGPAGNTVVQRGSLRSRSCRSGPAGEHCDLDFAVVVVVAAFSLLWLFPSLLFICPYCRKQAARQLMWCGGDLRDSTSKLWNPPGKAAIKGQPSSLNC